MSCLTLASGAFVTCPAFADDGRNLFSFSDSGQEQGFYKLHAYHRDWMTKLQDIFSNPGCIGLTAWAEGMQQFRAGQSAELETYRPGIESFFGKEFFEEFTQYHQATLNGIVNFMREDFQSAKTSLDEAMAAAGRLKHQPVKHKEYLSDIFADKMYLQALICQAVVDSVSGHPEAGTASLRSAHDSAAGIPWRLGQAQALFCMASTAEWLKTPTAKELYENALEIAREYRIHDYIWKACDRLAWMHWVDGHLEVAASFWEEAVTSIEFMRTKMEDDQRRLAFLGDKGNVYCSLIRVLMEKGDARRALEVAENSKSRVLQDLLDSSNKLVLSGAGHDLLLIQEQVLAEKMETLEGREDEEAQTRLDALKKAHENVMANIRQNNPDFGVLKVGVSADLDDIQALLDDRTVLLEYAFVPDLIAWLITRDSIRAEKIPIEGPALTQKVQAIHTMIRKPKSPAVYRLLSQLYGLIIQPFEKDIKDKDLIIVPSEALYYLPFAPLMEKSGRFLVEQHAISIVPSSGVLSYCRARKKHASKSVLAFGNPDLEDSKLDLPHTQIEVEKIVGHFSGGEPGLLTRGGSKTDLPNAQTEVRSQVHVRKEATETLAKKVMGDFDIIHFACHGQIDDGNPMHSCLRLAPDQSNDGKLTTAEIFDLKLDAQLVILSGCETGRGQSWGGDELIGLTRSFLYAGTPCVIASLWKVDDSATSQLMEIFYGNLAKMGKSEALRRAQIQAMRAKKHPYYWAAFYLVGDGR